ncbi:MAG: hypothetical protein KatS3mg102_1362 [Planctomycetota bacterium]|nr:MAG: hypothetical protein KatS3mg102_1362 [Planctomycetota bacterium]
MRGTGSEWLRAAAVLAVALGCAALPVQAQGQGEQQDKPKLPRIGEVTKGFEVREGFFTIYQDKQKLLVEIPRGRIGKPFLLATTLSGGMPVAGVQWTDALVEWQRLDEDKLLLIEKNVRYRAEERDPRHEVVNRTYSDRVVQAVKILAEEPGSPRRGVLIDASRLFARHADAFFGDFAKQLDPDVARIDKAKAFPENIEVAVTMPARQGGELVTLHYSMVSLPPAGYTPRVADTRVGYFLTVVKDFSKEGGDDRFVRYINRWRLEKAEPGLKLSPPKRPIVFYIEKTVPVRYRRFVREGILAWNAAFEKIGFSDAIVVRQQTADNEFADLDPEDARYSFFRWITSDSAFAMGPSRVHPMTGEIFDADIIFDDSMVRAYLREYELMLKRTPGAFFAPEGGEQAAAGPPVPAQALDPWLLFGGEHEAWQLSPAGDRVRGLCALGSGRSHELAIAELALLAAAARKGGDGGGKPEGEQQDKEEFPEEFIGAMITEVVMHEVGHTLGLRHNFAASTLLPLEKINSEERPRITTGSVMDYNPINVVGPEGVQGEYITRGLGPYDYWAIAYGYQPVKSEQELAKIAAQGTRPEFIYATDEDTVSPDPYVNRFDLGSDPLAYARQRVELSRWLLGKVADRLVAEGESYARLRRAVDALLWEVLRAGWLASRFVGGERYHRNHKGDPDARPPIEIVPAAKQREALAFIREQVFAADALRLDPELMQFLAAERWRHWGMPGQPAPFDYQGRVLAIQRAVLLSLFAADRLQRLADQPLKVSGEFEPLTLGELFQAVSEAIFAELEPHRELAAGEPFVSTVRRNLQRAYLDLLIGFTVNDRPAGPPITRALAVAQLTALQPRLGAVLERADLDAESRAHLLESRLRIDKALDAVYRVR